MGLAEWGSDPVLDALKRPSLPAGGRGEREQSDRQPGRLPPGEGGGAGGSAPWVLMGGHNADRKDESRLPQIGSEFLR